MHMSRVFLLLLLLAAPLGAQNITISGPSVDIHHGPLRVSKNHRFLEYSNGGPFVYVGDTAWELFHRLTREDTEYYLEARRAQGFTAIQAVVLAEFAGLDTPTASGEKPLV